MHLDHIQRDKVKEWNEKHKFSAKDPRNFLSEFKHHDLCPHFASVPKHPLINSWWREDVARRLILGTKREREWVLVCCKEDPLWFINSFLFIHEPRNESGSRTFPFLTFPYQDQAILSTLEVYGKGDIIWKKSRDVGASWVSLAVQTHKYLFEQENICGLLTLDEKTCDSRYNPSSLFSKIELMLKRLPKQIHDFNADTDRAKLRIFNKKTGSGFFGYACTGDPARGGRTSAFLIDELDSYDADKQFDVWASLSYVTNCRFVISTPRQKGALYYKLLAESEQRGITVVNVMWHQDPRRNRGLYTSRGDKLELLDKEYWRHFGEDSYKDDTNEPAFVLDGKVRSPWYDKACREAGSPQQIARELDCDFAEVESNYFPTGLVDEITEQSREPVHRGQIVFDEDTTKGEFVETLRGGVHVWVPLSPRDRRPVAWSRYVIGVDLCQGLGGDYTSNSVIEVIDRATCEQVAEFSSRTTLPADMADTVVGMARWLNDAHVIWDAEGPGRSFTKRMEHLGYPHVYWYRPADQRYGKAQNKMGFYIKSHNKDSLLGRLRNALTRKELKLNSPDLADELTQFVFKDGRVEHAKALITTDDGAKGLSHGDHVLAMALAWWFHCELPAIDPLEPPRQMTDECSMAWRMEYHRQKEDEEEAWV